MLRTTPLQGPPALLNLQESFWCKEKRLLSITILCFPKEGGLCDKKGGSEKNNNKAWLTSLPKVTSS